MKRWTRPGIAASILLVMATQGASAQGMEESFRRFLDGLKAKGQAVLPVMGHVADARTPTIADRTDALPLGQVTAVVFIADGCRACAGVPEKLRASLGSVEVMNISTSATAREAFTQTGAKALPATILGKRLLTGYDPNLVKRAVVEDMQRKGSEAAREGGA